MSDTRFDIGPALSAFVAAQVAEGRYASGDEVVRAAVILLRDHEARVAELRAALEAGERSGIAEDFNFDAFMDELDREPRPAA